MKRFTPRLKLMATGPTFIDFAVPEERDPVEVCSMHYLQPIQHFTEQDRLLETAFTAVMYRICSTLFEVRHSLLEKQKRSCTEQLAYVENEAGLIEDMNTWLDWSDWITCGHCAIDQGARSPIRSLFSKA